MLRLGRMSIDVRRGVSSRLQHPRVPRYFLHHHLWTLACSCMSWFRHCRPRCRLRRHCRLSCRLRLRLQLQFPRSMAMVVRPSWRSLREWLCPLLRGRALSAACKQESKMDQYLEEKKAAQKRSTPPFQRQDRKKAVYQSPQHPVELRVNRQ
ncbi:hypothetical protein Taro_031827 [Colocasia esculenta]|uniref:Uncharacterized protein n=1 Tax=Colocasia esculenta TaxID=4460 RepID=A0A843VT31_COLES|nr:hypothetical protein [Colocasia esculenta]